MEDMKMNGDSQNFQKFILTQAFLSVILLLSLTGHVGDVDGGCTMYARGDRWLERTIWYLRILIRPHCVSNLLEFDSLALYEFNSYLQFGHSLIFLW